MRGRGAFISLVTNSIEMPHQAEILLRVTILGAYARLANRNKTCCPKYSVLVKLPPIRFHWVAMKIDKALRELFEKSSMLLSSVQRCYTLCASRLMATARTTSLQPQSILLHFVIVRRQRGLLELQVSSKRVSRWQGISTGLGMTSVQIKLIVGTTIDRDRFD